MVSDTDVPVLTDRDRLLGFEFLRLVGSWPHWIHRRIETITWESTSSIRRQVSVDLRLTAEYFGRPQFRWDEADVHYVPIAQLRKHRLLGFDVRDESGNALPMMTRRKNALIAAGMLSALAQTLIANKLASASPRPPFGGEEIHAIDIFLPEELEARFWQLAYPLSPQDRPDPAYSEFLPQDIADLRDPIDWDWARQGDGLWHADAPETAWRWNLSRDPGFVRFATDVARLFLLCVPLRWEPGRRRIVKFSYTDYLALRSPSGVQATKNLAARATLAGAWNWLEDRLEGLPATHGSVVEWMPAEELALQQQGRIRQLWAGGMAAIGLAAKQILLRASGVGHAASYHMNVTLPSGIQVRHAQLTLETPFGGTRSEPAVRAFSGVRTVDLYTSGAGSDQTADVDLRVKPGSAVIVRGAALAGLLVSCTIALALHFAPKLEMSAAAAQSAAALLVVVPGFVAAYASRDAGHPLATSMLLGLRVAALFPAVGSLAMAGLIVLRDGRSPAAYADVICVAVVTIFLIMAWRLADRGLPHSSAR